MQLRRNQKPWLAGLVIAMLGIWASAAALERGRAVLGLPRVEQVPLAAEVELGRRLFMDPVLSASGRMSCATCHVPEQGFTQNERATPAGADGTPLRRNAPTLLNVAFAHPLMHDGAAPSLRVQVLTPLLHANEMANSSFGAVEQRVRSRPEYRAAFQAVYGDAPSMARIGEALATYQMTLTSGDSPFDRWKYGDDPDALTAQARKGFVLFTGKAGCSGCHRVGSKSALFTDNGMHRTGAGGSSVRPVRLADRDATALDAVDFSKAGDRGRHEVTQRPDDLYKFRTPTLRNVALTAPYMHDGSLTTIEDVVRFYDAGGGGTNVDPRIKPLGLTDEDVGALVAFLNSLTGSNVGALAQEARAAAPKP